MPRLIHPRPDWINPVGLAVSLREARIDEQFYVGVGDRLYTHFGRNYDLMMGLRQIVQPKRIAILGMGSLFRDYHEKIDIPSIEHNESKITMALTSEPYEVAMTFPESEIDVFDANRSLVDKVNIHQGPAYIPVMADIPALYTGYMDMLNLPRAKATPKTAYTDPLVVSEKDTSRVWAHYFNMLHEPFPSNSYDLVIALNSLIYVTQDIVPCVLTLLLQAVCEGGIVAVNGVSGNTVEKVKQLGQIDKQHHVRLMDNSIHVLQKKSETRYSQYTGRLLKRAYRQASLAKSLSMRGPIKPGIHT